ncbi:DUF948 domain-containing protein [Paenibacillus humicola]|uniref:DUF948 domain-containing protein n=1 Tax=Paenibacillus humicola TaxID=3110540 RepID=UPI00237A2B09|nr:DUF948 domain-containing protein [Paenibacillus humicola]
MLDIAMLLIGISVAVLTVFAILMLRKAQASFNAASLALREVRDAVHIWKDDIEGLVRSARKLTDQVQGQLAAAEPAIETVRETGEALHELAAAARGISSVWSAKLQRKARTAAEKEAAARRTAEMTSAAAAPGTAAARLEAAAAAERPAYPGPGTESEASPEQAALPAWLVWAETGLHAAKWLARRR